MKRVYKITLLMAVSLLLFVFAGCGKKQKTIDVNAYVKLEFEGYDTIGTVASSEFQEKKLLNDNEKELEGATKKDLQKLFGSAFIVDMDKEGHLQNGDEVKIRWKVDEDELAEFEKQYKVKFVYDDFTCTVKGLEEMEKVDLFEGIEVRFEGVAPEGYARINSYSNYSSVRFVFDKQEGLKNGDTVTVTASCAYEDKSLSEYMAERYQKLPQTETKTFTVSGLSTYVTELSQISDAQIKEIDAFAKERLSDLTARWNNPESYQGATYMGPIFVKNQNDRSTLYLTYKIDVDSARSGAMSYYAYAVYNSRNGLVLDGEGNFEISKDRVTVMSDSFWLFGHNCG